MLRYAGEMMRKFIGFVYEMVSIYTQNRVSRSAAEFSYFLTLSIFPLLICVTAIFTSLNINQQSLLVMLSGILPENTVKALGEYVEYVMENYDDSMLVVGLMVMATSSAGVMRSLINIMTDIQGVARYRGLHATVVSFIFSIVFLFAFYLSIVIVVTGGWFMDILDSFFGVHRLIYIWGWLRFIILFLILILIVNFLYKFTGPKGQRAKLPRLIGAFVATISIVIFSIIFSGIISLSSKYSVVYGSLSAIIILMIWAYTCGLILIMGNVLNIVLRRKIRRFRHSQGE